MTIRAKILCLVAAFALLAATITGLSLATMSDYNRIIADYRHHSENAFRGERLNRLIVASAIEMRGLYLDASRAEQLRQAERVAQRTTALKTFIEDWNSRHTADDLPELAGVRDDVLAMVTGGLHLADVMREEGAAAAEAYGNKPEYRVAREAMHARIDAMVAGLDARLAASQAELTRFETERQHQFLIMAASGILLLLGGSLWIAIDGIANPLTRVRESMVRISEGAYDTEIPAQTRGEIGELWTALGILKNRAAEAERLSRQQLEDEHRLRELVLD